MAGNKKLKSFFIDSKIPKLIRHRIPILTNAEDDIIKGMILEILLNNPKPKPQEGVVVKFKRRSLEDGNLKNAKNLNEVYNYIRMLDADEYPQSFISSGDYLFEFSDASIVKNEVIAKVKIKRQKHD